MGEREANELDLRGYLRVFRRRKWLIVIITAAVLGAGLASTLSKTPRYRATAELLIAPKRSEQLFNGSSGQVAQETSRYVATEIKVLTSEAVRDVAAKKLGFQATVRAFGSQADNVVTVSADSVDPKRAADVVNTYVTAYIEYRRQANVTDSLKAQNVIQLQVDAKQREIDALDRAIQRAPAPQRDALKDAQSDKRASLINQQDLFRSQIDQLQIGAGLNSGEAQLLTPATVPTDPFDPRPVAAGILFLLLGLALGVGLAFVREYLDDSLRTKEDLDAVTGGLPVLGMIPVVRGWRRHGKAYTVTMAAPTSVAAESYRSLRTSIQFLGLDRPIRTLQLTSPAASEGKTTTVSNLAAALADAGQRVVIVDCDLRRSRVHEFFGLTNEVGFTSVLLGEVPLSEALHTVPGVERLQVLAAGPRPPNPSELLSGRRTLEVFTALQSHADIVVIDSPPVLPVSDAVILAAQVDATLLVTNARKTHRRPLGRAMELLRQVEAPLIGAVLNLASADAAYGYGYGYGYYGYKYTGKDGGERDRVPARSS